MVLGSDDDSISIKSRVTFNYLASKPHRLKRILDFKTKRLHSKLFKSFKLNGRIVLLENSLKTNFPVFLIARVKYFREGNMLQA